MSEKCCNNSNSDNPLTPLVVPTEVKIGRQQNLASKHIYGYNKSVRKFREEPGYTEGKKN